MRTTLRALPTLLLAGVLGLSSVAAASATALLPAAAPEIIGADGDYRFVEAWDVLGSEYTTMIDMIEASPTGDVFVLSSTSMESQPGVVRMSGEGERLGTWGYSYGDTESYAHAVAAEVDADGNLHILLDSIYDEDNPEQRNAVVVYSPAGERLSTQVLHLGENLYPQGMTLVDGVTYVASSGQIDEDTYGLVITGHDAAGKQLSRFALPEENMTYSYDNLVHSSDGRLVSLLQNSSGSRWVAVHTPDGTLVTSWETPMVDEWEQQAEVVRIAVGPRDEVVLNDHWRAAHVLTLDGTVLQTLDLLEQRESVHSHAQAVGSDGRVFVASDSPDRELLVFERLTAPSVSEAAWVATQCVAFTEQVEATGTPAVTHFEVTSGSLPEGITLDEATGTVSGTSTAAGEQTVTIAAHNGVTDAGTQSFTLTVAPGVFTSTTVPAVTGTAAVGSTLTASVKAWEPVADVTYQWLRDGQPIASATTSSYTLVASDAGADVSVRATGTADCAETAEVDSPALSVAGTPSGPGTDPETTTPGTAAPGTASPGTAGQSGANGSDGAGATGDAASALASTGTSAWVAAGALALALGGTTLVLLRRSALRDPRG